MDLSSLHTPRKVQHSVTASASSTSSVIDLAFISSGPCRQASMKSTRTMQSMRAKAPLGGPLFESARPIRARHRSPRGVEQKRTCLQNLREAGEHQTAPAEGRPDSHRVVRRGMSSLLVASCPWRAGSSRSQVSEAWVIFVSCFAGEHASPASPYEGGRFLASVASLGVIQAVSRRPSDQLRRTSCQICAEALPH